MPSRSASPATPVAEQPSPRVLPAFVEPMLAVAGEAFDSDRHLFEVKWDGTRGLAYADADGTRRLMNRRRLDIAARYPELAPALAALPAGSVVDGEVVVMREGRPDFGALLRRDEVRSDRRAAELARSLPATYVVFDLLYERFAPVVDLPCEARRERLAALLARAGLGSGRDADGNTRLVMSQGVVGAGRAYFERAVAMGLEGVVAKRRDGRYRPGKRSDAWVKVKRHELVHCAVVGFVPEGTRDFASLLLAALPGGGGQAAAATTVDCEPAYVGRVGSGFDRALRDRVNAYLWSRPRGTPVVPCDRVAGARWVEPGLYCVVRCMERTAAGHLRAPVIEDVYGA